MKSAFAVVLIIVAALTGVFEVTAQPPTVAEWRQKEKSLGAEFDAFAIGYAAGAMHGLMLFSTGCESDFSVKELRAFLSTRAEASQRVIDAVGRYVALERRCQFGAALLPLLNGIGLFDVEEYSRRLRELKDLEQKGGQR